jgi:ribonuclease P protein component
VIGRLLRSADFERVLRTRSRASSTHFAVHHLPDRPTRPHKPSSKHTPMAEQAELSTAAAPLLVEPVDDLAPCAEPSVWLGAVVPKRHARRSVTRSLLKRQIRAVVGARAEVLLVVGGSAACAVRQGCVSECCLRGAQAICARRARTLAQRRRAARACALNRTALAHDRRCNDCASARSDIPGARLPIFFEPVAGQRVQVRADLLCLFTASN